jgi:hypothetical protein
LKAASHLISVFCGRELAMTAQDPESDLAAALTVALETGALSLHEAVAVIDREIEAQVSPDGWLIEGSLAQSSEDLLHVLRVRAVGHPMLADPWTLIEAMDKALSRGVDVMEVAGRVKVMYPYGDWPGELNKLLYDLYEEVTCAHMHGGVPSRTHVEAALRALLAEGRGRSTWCPALERVLA